MKAAVIGCGLGGLSAALYLRHAGFEVDVFEKNATPGGKAGSLKLGKYRFDTGPSLFTLPEVFDDIFELFGESRRDWFELEPLDPVCRYVFGDDTRLDAFFGKEALGKAFERFLGVPRQTLIDYLDYSGGIYRLAADLFLKNPLSWKSMIGNPAAWKVLFQIGKLDSFRTMERANRSFFSDPRAVQFFNRFATYNGSDPYSAPATLNMIPFLEFCLGGYAVRQGIYAVPSGLHRLAEKNGIRFHFNTSVKRIILKSNKIKGLEISRSDGTCAEPDYSCVVCNADIFQAYPNLLGDTKDRYFRRAAKQEPSSSGIVFYWGMKEKFPELLLNNIFFSSDYAKEFRQIFKNRQVPENPTIYVNITSKITKSDAPEGCENWFVLINVPWDDGRDWTEEVVRVRKAALTRLEQALGRPIERAIEVEDTLDPLKIWHNMGSYRGSLYGTSSNSRFAAFLRHPNRSKRYKGLYFCGGSGHPGGGMPLVTLSGKIAARLAVRDLT